MIKVYKMPNGKKYRFEESEAPAGAVAIEKKKAPEKKAAPKTKAKKPVNKARKAADK